MSSKIVAIKIFLIFFIAVLIVSTNASVQAKNNLPDALDIVVKISHLEETLKIFEDFVQTASKANTPPPTNMLRGMLHGTDWIDPNRPIVIGIILNETRPEIAALIPFQKQNNNFQAAYNAFSGTDYYIMTVPPIPDAHVSESLKNALVEASGLKSGDSLSITMNVSKIMKTYYDKIQEFMAQIENMPSNQELDKLDISQHEIREMLQKSIDTLSEIETISTGLNLNESIFEAFLKAEAIQGSALRKLFTSTGDTVLLDNYSPQYQINFKSHSYDIAGMVEIINNCFGNFYKKMGIDFSSMASVYADFTGEMAGGINFENGKMVFESISILKKGKNYADFMEKTYLPWLEQYSINMNKMLSKQLSAKQQNLTWTRESIVKGYKVYGIKVNNLPFFPVPGQAAMTTGIAQNKQMFEYDMRMTVLDDLFITAPNDKRIGELIQISGNFKEKKSSAPLMSMNIDIASYIKMIIGMVPVQGLNIGKPPEMGRIIVKSDTSNGTINTTTSIMINDIKKVIAWAKDIDFSNMPSALDQTDSSNIKTEAEPVNQTDNHKKTRVMNENNVEYWREKGAICSTYGNDKAAIKYYKKVIELDPNRIDAYFQLGISYGETGAYQKAIVSINKALQADPQNGLYFYGRGRVYLLSGDEQKGIDDLKLAAVLGNRDAQDYLQSSFLQRSATRAPSLKASDAAVSSGACRQATP